MIAHLFQGSRNRWAASTDASAANLPSDSTWSHVGEVDTLRKRIGMGMDERLAELEAKGFIISEITVTFE